MAKDVVEVPLATTDRKVVGKIYINPNGHYKVQLNGWLNSSDLQWVMSSIKNLVDRLERSPVVKTERI